MKKKRIPMALCRRMVGGTSYDAHPNDIKDALIVYGTMNTKQARRVAARILEFAYWLEEK